MLTEIRARVEELQKETGEVTENIRDLGKRLLGLQQSMDNLVAAVRELENSKKEHEKVLAAQKGMGR